MCEELARRGSILVVADLDIAAAQNVVASLRENGGDASAAEVDVASAASVQSLISRAVIEHGRIDYMFNNAGIAVGGELRDLPLEYWRRIIDVNLLGVIYGTTYAYAQMLRQGFGHIINTASVAGLIGFPGAVPYATTKSGVVGLSLSLRSEAAELGVKVSVICPGFVQTNIFSSSILVNAPKDQFIEQIPFRIISPEEAAREIVRGVIRNKSVIVFPFYARLLWWLNRVAPGIIARVNRQAIARFRKIREVSSQ